MDYVNNKVTDIDAIPGERWFPKESSFEDDIRSEEHTSELQSRI